MERSDYDSALQLRSDFATIMQNALNTSAVMLMPILAGAAPKVKRADAPLDEAAQALATLSEQYAGLVCMSGCPCAVLPVPAPDDASAPWAVLLVARHRCDSQLLQLAVRLSAQIEKTAAALAKVCACTSCAAHRSSLHYFVAERNLPGLFDVIVAVQKCARLWALQAAVYRVCSHSCNLFCYTLQDAGAGG